MVHCELDAYNVSTVCVYMCMYVCTVCICVLMHVRACCVCVIGRYCIASNT